MNTVEKKFVRDSGDYQGASDYLKAKYAFAYVKLNFLIVRLHGKVGGGVGQLNKRFRLKNDARTKEKLAYEMFGALL
jgi:hypothetical protein